METIYRNEQFAFYLILQESVPRVENLLSDTDTVTASGSPARMQIIREEEKGDGEPLVLMDYTFPVQLNPSAHVGQQGTLLKDEHGREILTFTLELEVHHVTGMVQGEFTETEHYGIRNPFGELTAEETPDPSLFLPDSGGSRIQCIVTDIERKTLFASAPRHLEHLPKQTYPPVNGRQGPYGHPSIRSLPQIQRRRHSDESAADSVSGNQSPGSAGIDSVNTGS